MNTLILYFLGVSLQFPSQKNIPAGFPDSNTNMVKNMDRINSTDEKISGKYLDILMIAFNEFKKEQKKISDFEIYIENNKDNIEITFVPNFSPGEKILGGRTSLGRSATYTFSNQTREIIKVNYHR